MGDYGTNFKEQEDIFLTYQEKMHFLILIGTNGINGLGVKVNSVELGLSHSNTGLNLGLHTFPIIPRARVFPAGRMGIDRRAIPLNCKFVGTLPEGTERV